jgi:TP901-1 family phage major tail protein
MSKILGTNLLLGHLIDGAFSAFAYSKACTIDEQADTIEISSPTSGKWQEFLTSRFSWSMSCECLLSSDNSTIEDAFRKGEPIEVSCRNRDTAGKEYRGRAIITNLRATGRIHEMSTYSITLKGTGKLDYQSIT